ncbi:MAG: sn-glycerol-3-phosphate ABC transporter ATP-binding protein UgpC [Natronospirillum sp.]|uniref:sn-glycerol-3-phosphate ABC transporter ATP-binding protein UgpC n=1 Tax=Natronospirillum sp. TaxID=2812955 RepID=UPI0025EE2662|nr:sn-glycerol-3-phosphate ABC transporter ATP-binding protein UgpC [Natronospirillum sp.]MCH8550295.1 sn-glycerol-3-phosphate ABC transporter ATP-binding protein UgpC [Natronospirillum sp.]
MAAIKIEGLGKVYPGDIRAVQDINLDIADGEFIVLVGPSGCGKSTLLRMVAGLETITEGELSIGNKVVNQLEPAERDIAMVFQNYALYPHMTVYKNLAYGLKNRGFSQQDIDERVQNTAKMLEINPFLDRKPRALSGGQRQRVAMGRALVREPAAFLLDEPLSNLDAKLRVQMRVEIKQLQRRLKTTSLYVTHDQLEAMTLGDRLVVLNQGRIEQVGSPMDVYHRPETLFVAEFIGSPSMNIVRASTFANKDNQEAVKQLPEGTDVIGVRPDTVVFEKPAEPHLSFDCEVKLFEPAGAESHLYLHLLPDRQAFTMRVEENTAVAEGGKIMVYAPLSVLHPFNEASGRRTD